MFGLDTMATLIAVLQTLVVLVLCAAILFIGVRWKKS